MPPAMPSFFRATRLALLGALMLVPALAGSLSGAAARAAPRATASAAFDGHWSVVVITDRGPCDRAYRYEMRIERGRISYAGNAAVDFSGRVTPAGTVRVDLGQGQAIARGTGKLGHETGAGVWTGQSPNGACGGRWEAERR